MAKKSGYSEYPFLDACKRFRKARKSLWSLLVREETISKLAAPPRKPRNSYMLLLNVRYMLVPHPHMLVDAAGERHLAPYGAPRDKGPDYGIETGMDIVRRGAPDEYLVEGVVSDGTVTTAFRWHGETRPPAVPSWEALKEWPHTVVSERVTM